MKTSKHFLSCDWGTSSFRLRLVEANTELIAGEINSARGIATLFTDWQQALQDKRFAPSQRIGFYVAYLRSQIQWLSEQVAQPIHTVPVLISGMASSSIGMHELPYTSLPFLLDGTGVPRVYE